MDQSKVRAFLSNYFLSIRDFSSETTIGLEQEGVFLDSNNFLSLRCDEVISSANTGELNLEGIELVGELSLFSFELNGFLEECTAEGFLNLLGKLKFASDLVARASKKCGLRLLYTGIPASLRREDLTSKVLRRSDRIDLLERAWKERFDALEVKPQINGYTPESIAITGCCSSSQFHVSLPPSDAEAVEVWNAAHLATIPLIGVAANSKYFLGEKAHAETRNAIWRYLDDLDRGRVFFGPIVRDSMMEVAEQYLSLPSLKLEKDPAKDQFEEYQRHAKSIWPFIRLVLGRDHWRIENRAIASSSPKRTIANFAIFLGLMSNVSDIQDLFQIDFSSDLTKHFFGVSEGGIKYLSTLSGLSVKETRSRIIRIAVRGLISRGFNQDSIEQLISPILQLMPK